MHATRRRFLQTAGSAAALGLADLSFFRELPAAQTQPSVNPEMIRFSPALEPIVRLIEQTPREKCIPVMVEQLRGGLPYRQFLSSIFLAAVRKTNSHHAVYMVHSAHQISLDLPPEEMLLPLFWAMDGLKWQQEAFPTPPMAPFNGALVPADKALEAFNDAMQKMDADASEAAVVSLLRNHGLAQTMEAMWPYACRDVSVIGHRAIAVTNSCRVLETIGVEHAEPVLRAVVGGLYSRGGGRDQYYQPNIARAERLLGKLTGAWAAGEEDSARTADLFALLRQGKSAEACDLAAEQLAGGATAQAIWDAVHVGAAEVLLLHRGGTGMSTRPVHVNTSANALHYGFRHAQNERTRLITLLQAVAWVGDFVRVQTDGKGLAGDAMLDLGGARVPDSPAVAIADVFSALPPHAWTFDIHTKTGAGHNLINSEARVEPSKIVYALTRDNPQSADLFLRTARGWLAMKATVEAHDYKLPASLFEEFGSVSAAWRPRLLAASMRWIHGKQSPDSMVFQQAREAMKRVG